MIPTPGMSHNINPSIMVTSSIDTSMSVANASIASMNFNTGSLLPTASMNNGSFGRSEGYGYGMNNNNSFGSENLYGSATSVRSMANPQN
ncbi:hypothetical protein V6N13_147425 [Hibiscus sabdariffa]|uniref:Uncharacterized protein n=1 Tax=Hibiscus sabdariffa TaxID=183260 RepID=A0ABR2TVL2_9ROSI